MLYWCFNGLKITGTEAHIATFAEQANGPVQSYQRRKTKDVSVLSFHLLVPIPDKVLAKPYDMHSADEGMLARAFNEILGVQEDIESMDGYHAEIALWGVKWGASNARIVRDNIEEVCYVFNTPNAPPAQFVYRVSLDFTTLSFSIAYAEPEIDLRGGFRIEAGTEHILEISPGPLYPDEEEYDDDYEYERALGLFYRQYEQHVWDLVGSGDNQNG